MGATSKELTGLDLTKGVPVAMLKEGLPLQGHVKGEALLLVRRGSEVFAVGAHCTHYGGPLAEGIVVGDGIRCPWHHACFSLRTGAVTAAPALSPLPRWEVELRNEMVFVSGEPLVADALAPQQRTQTSVRKVVIVGGGAGGNAAAEELRRYGFEGEIAVIDPDIDAPYDRPNLSKDYLAGSAPAEWLPLRPPAFHDDRGIMRLPFTATAIDGARKVVKLSGGAEVSYDALVLATGAAPIRIPIPGADLPHVHVLRTLADCRKLIEALEHAKRVVIAGASFIGMEAAAAMRAREVEVTVVAPEKIPFSQVLGPTIGGSLKQLHEQHGVTFKLGRSVHAISEHVVMLDDGAELPADVVLLAVGVRPRLEIAAAAGLTIDRGVLVNEYLESSVPGIYAVGDIARFPHPDSGANIRVEHWVVAQRQGAVAARNILGWRERYASVPFFWTSQYERTVNYVGHVEDWTHIQVDGSPETDCAVSFMDGDRLLAYVTIGRDRESLKMERELEHWAI